MNSKAEQYKRSVAEEMASKRSKQNKFGEEIRVQIDEVALQNCTLPHCMVDNIIGQIRKRNQREAEERQAEARRVRRLRSLERTKLNMPRTDS